jgi:hypothetical protein
LWMNARAHVLNDSGTIFWWPDDRCAKSAINSSSIALARNKASCDGEYDRMELHTYSPCSPMHELQD